MAASDSHIESNEGPLLSLTAIRQRHTKPYFTARLWMSILNQDEYWVGRDAWPRYAGASLFGWTETPVYGIDPNTGEDVYDGPTMRYLTVKPRFDVEGVLKVSDLDLQHKRNVITFMWRHTRNIVSSLSWATLVDPLYQGEMPYEVEDEIIENDMAYMDMAENESRRREWFNELPLIKALRAQIIDERDSRFQGPVLLGQTS